MTDQRSRKSAALPHESTALPIGDEQHDEPHGELETILETADPALLPVVRSLLDGAGIPYLVQGDRAMGLMPLGPFSASYFGRALAARVRVPAAHAEEAKALLAAEPEAVPELET